MLDSYSFPALSSTKTILNSVYSGSTTHFPTVIAVRMLPTIRDALSFLCFSLVANATVPLGLRARNFE